MPPVSSMLIRETEKSRSHLRPIGRGCEACGLPLMYRCTRDITRKRFCSWACAGNASKLARKQHVVPTERRCARCDQTFWGERGLKYCGVKCRGSAASAALEKRRESIEWRLAKLCSRPGRDNLSGAYLVNLYRLQQGRCAITGAMMTWASGAGHVSTNVSIDRIRPKGRYEPGNVRLVCHVVNLMRRDMPDEEFVGWCRAVVNGSQAGSPQCQ